jgi:hypothetical protein
MRWCCTGVEEDGEAEVDDLERGVLGFVGEEEVLRLEVPVDHPVRVAQLRHRSKREDSVSYRLVETCYMMFLLMMIRVPPTWTTSTMVRKRFAAARSE